MSSCMGKTNKQASKQSMSEPTTLSFSQQRAGGTIKIKIPELNWNISKLSIASILKTTLYGVHYMTETQR